MWKSDEEKKNRPTIKLDYNKGDYQMLNEKLESTNWHKELGVNENANVDEVWEKFKVNLFEKVNRFVPKNQRRSHWKNSNYTAHFIWH